MKDSRSFWKKHGFFILLLSVLLLISSSLFIYSYVRHRASSSPFQTDQKEEPSDKDMTDGKAEIKEFEGKYNRTTQQVDFSWSYQANGTKISSVKLFLQEDELIDVTGYSSWSLSREMYGIPTGTNEFALQITQENGEQITKTVRVFVNYVTYMEQSVKAKSNSMEIVLTYEYEKRNPIEEPQMILLDDSLPYYQLLYKGTTQEEKNGVIRAKTTYEIFWNVYSAEVDSFSVRWRFKEHSENNRDYTIDKAPTSTPKEDGEEAS